MHVHHRSLAGLDTAQRSQAVFKHGLLGCLELGVVTAYSQHQAWALLLNPSLVLSASSQHRTGDSSQGHTHGLCCHYH